MFNIGIREKNAHVMIVESCSTHLNPIFWFPMGGQKHGALAPKRTGIGDGCLSPKRWKTIDLDPSPNRW